MREITFRGKRADNGEWVFGDYSRYSKDKSIIMVDLLEQECYWVPSETVGQYTGLKDKDWVGIYEGDIVKGISENAVYKVFYNQNLCGFSTKIGLIGLMECEVIGNIHDNPELLKD